MYRISDYILHFAINKASELKTSVEVGLEKLKKLHTFWRSLSTGKNFTNQYHAFFSPIHVQSVVQYLRFNTYSINNKYPMIPKFLNMCWKILQKSIFQNVSILLICLCVLHIHLCAFIYSNLCSKSFYNIITFMQIY